MHDEHDDAALIAWLHDEGESERARLAREIHDELGGILVAARMDLASLARRLTPEQIEAQAQIGRIGAALDAAVMFQRRLVDQLRPGVLEHLGLFAALRYQLQSFCDEARLGYDGQLPDNEPDFTAEAATMLFRMQHAALQDVAARGSASQVRFTLVLTEAMMLEMCIADQGNAPPPASAAETHRFALQCHRARRFGGTCDVERRADGISVSVQVPLARLIAA